MKLPMTWPAAMDNMGGVRQAAEDEMRMHHLAFALGLPIPACHRRFTYLLQTTLHSSESLYRAILCGRGDALAAMYADEG